MGFNCVYHLTDTPTFLANIEGEGLMLCAMDPRYAFRVILFLLELYSYIF